MSLLWTNSNISHSTNKIGNSKHRNPSPKHIKHSYSLARGRFSNFLSEVFIKGISLPAFFRKRTKASMTVEASIVLPLFLFFFFNLSCAVEMMRLHGSLELALCDVGKQLSVYGYALEAMKEKNETERGRVRQTEKQSESAADAALWDKLSGVAFSYAYIRGEMVKYAGENYLNESPMTHGADGLQFLESEIWGDGDCFEIIATYSVSPWMSLAGFRSFRMVNKYYGHIWNGYEIPVKDEMQEGDRDTVYMTQHGEVYHENRNCSYLNLSVSEADRSEVEQLRNENGTEYTLCAGCKDAERGSKVYVTKEGRRFHYDRECSGLKRTVYSVLKITVKDKYPACKRCSGRN